MSFTKKISHKNNNELTKVANTAFIPDGVYILHDTLGVKSVNGWKPKDNEGVVGILLVEDEHRIVVALEDAPYKLTWSKKRGKVNQPVEELEDAKSDFNGEYYCRNLNSPDFPAAYYCSNYKKGGCSWYLPSAGELWLIYNHLEEIQSALESVGGQKLNNTSYWSSTEVHAIFAWHLTLGSVLGHGRLVIGYYKVSSILNVRPVSKFNI